MIRRPPRSTLERSSAASDVYKRQSLDPDLRTQEIHVWLDMATQQLDSLSVRNKVKNVFYTLDEKLYFAPSKGYIINAIQKARFTPVSYTHLRAHETVLDLVCRLLLDKKTKQTHTHTTCTRIQIQNTIYVLHVNTQMHIEDTCVR